MNAEPQTVEKWASDGPNFWGTVRQLTACAKCGETITGYNTPRQIADMMKPTMHMICMECYETLPD